MNAAAKVGEIYREAGTAFTKLSEMTLMLDLKDNVPSGIKWSEAEVEMLHDCVNRFAVALNKISQLIKERTMRTNVSAMNSGTNHANGRSPPRQEQYMPPRQEQYMPPRQEQYMPPRQEQYMPPRQEQYMPPRQEQYMPPRQEQYMPPRQEQYMPPRQEQYMPPRQEQYMPPRQDQYMPPPVRPTKTFNEWWKQGADVIKGEKVCPSDNTKQNDLEDLFHFNPEIVPLTPPAILMEEDTQQHPSLGNINNLPKTFGRSIVTDSVCEANSKSTHIGTLHAFSTTTNNNNDPFKFLRPKPVFENFSYTKRPQRNTDPVPGAYTSFLSDFLEPHTLKPSSSLSPFCSQSICQCGRIVNFTQTVTPVGFDLSSATAEQSQEQVKTRPCRKRVSDYQNIKQNVPKKRQRKRK